MKKTALFIIATFVVAMFANAQVSDTKSKKVLNSVTEKLESYSTIKINFTFTEKKEGKTNSTKKGRVWTKGSKYYLKFAGQTIYSDGTTKWTYIKESEECHITDVDEGDDFANPLNLLKNYSSKFDTRWIREEQYKKNKVIIVDLYPKKDNKSYHRVRLRINKTNHQIVSTTVYNINNVSQTIDIDSFKTNEAIPDSTFVWKSEDHPGVEDIDLRE
ncbi:MAG: outer membrane lipoprotein carrier protein LolA [Bacteroidales bacterium]|nr:outer membrane lipoprotein carrier protein LolA [Bacteroidales bacterium]